MRMILEKRKALGNGPATPRELYDTLIEGGYEFETDIEQNRLTGVRVSLRKSSKIFHRLPDKKRYGLLEWYPNAKRQTAKDDDAGEDISTEPAESGEMNGSSFSDEVKEKATPDQE